MTLPRRFARVLVLVVSCTFLAVTAAPAFAQEFAKVEDGTREQLPATPFIAAAYGFIWVAILAYLLMTAIRLGRLRGELQDLRRRLDRGGAQSADSAAAPPPR